METIRAIEIMNGKLYLNDIKAFPNIYDMKIIKNFKLRLIY